MKESKSKNISGVNVIHSEGKLTEIAENVENLMENY